MARDTYKYFRIEASDILDRLSQGLIGMREGRTPPGGVRELLRLAHTLKGAAHVVNEAELAGAAHAMESRLTAHASESALTPDLSVQLLVEVERLAELLSRAEQQRAQAAPAPVSPPVPQAESETTEPTREITTQADDVPRTVRVDLDEMDQVVHGVTESMVRLSRVRSAVDTLDRVAALAGALVLNTGRAGARATQDRSARISALADNLNTTFAAAHRELAANVDQLERELSSLQESTAHLRLTPARGLFVAMERAVLSAAEQLGKRVTFIGTGGDMRVDAQLLAAVRNPLLHIVRNAVAHGIESAQERTRLGKNRAGRVELAVERRGSQVAFVCSDDGRGINFDDVRKIAVERGFLRSNEVNSARDDTLLSFLTRPGFTTQATANQVAGRGIGLDAVAASMAMLNGSVSIRTRAGVGTTVEVSAPAALLVTEVVFAEAGKDVIAIPAESIRETTRFTAPEVVSHNGRQQIASGDALLPYVCASVLLGTGDSTEAHTAIILEHQGLRAALGVERLRGTGTLVSRPLPAFVKAKRFVSGIALDQHGIPQLILHPAGLVAAAGAHVAPESVYKAPPLPILVVDDSLTTRMLEQSILEAAGYQVDVAVNAEQALVKAKERKYGLFLVDIEMPGMNGFEFVEVTRADEELRQVPAVLVTSRSSEEDRARGRRAGASEYITKSEFDQGYLLDRIRTLVRTA